MGVHGLWTLLEPVGRRIDIQAISNKRLAVGAWPYLSVLLCGVEQAHWPAAGSSACIACRLQSRTWLRRMLHVAEQTRYALAPANQ
jgi:hypothetical protein